MSTNTFTWKPLPDHPGYEINRSGSVRNARGYVVASGKGATLFVGGVRVGLNRKRLLELAAQEFAEPKLEDPKGSQDVVIIVASETEHAAAHEAPVEIVPTVVQEEPAPKPQRTYFHSRSGREIGDKNEFRIKPDHELPLRDPWADGSIEVESQWALQGVM